MKFSIDINIIVTVIKIHFNRNSSGVLVIEYIAFTNLKQILSVAT